MKVRYHPAAEREYLQQVAFYRQQRRELGALFVSAVEEALGRAADAPLRQAPAASGLSKTLLHRFPFTLLFVVDADVLTVIALAHHRRHPDYWRSRR